MHVPYEALNTGHRNTADCRYGRDLWRQREAAEAARRAQGQTFTACDVQLETVTSFRYLGRIITSTDDDWPALYRNLTKARKRWGMVSRVLVRDGASPRAMAMFYKAVVQSVLLYGSETWVLTDRMLKTLTGFHHRAARRITGMVAYRAPGGEWVYPPIDEVLKEAGMYTMEHYISKRRNRLVTYVATRPIYDLCCDAVRPSGSPNRMFWWDQVVRGDDVDVIDD